MIEYPSTSQHFKFNGKTYTMLMPTMGLQSRIEDDNIDVTKREIVKECTDLSDEELDTMHLDQFRKLYDELLKFSYGDFEAEGDGEAKKQ